MATYPKEKFPRTRRWDSVDEEERDHELSISVKVPEDAVEEILLRVPNIEDLLRFKSVSRPWLSMISEPSFAHNHLFRQHSSETNNSLTRFLAPPFCIDLRTPCEASVFSLHAAEAGAAAAALQVKEHRKLTIDWPWPRIFGWNARIFGSCNGLICLRVSNHELVLFNPSIPGVYQVLPSPCGRYGDIFLAGIGYHSSTGHYKVLCASTPSYATIFHILTLKTSYSAASSSSSWRKIEGNSEYIRDIIKDIYIHPQEYSCIYSNSSLNWLLCGLKRGMNSNVILSFGVTDEIFYAIQLPEDKVRTHSELMLGTLGDCLALTSYCGNGGHDIWILKNCDKSAAAARVMKPSWSKLITYRLPTNASRFRFTEFLIPLCLMGKTHVVLISNMGELVSVSLDDGGGHSVSLNLDDIVCRRGDKEFVPRLNWARTAIYVHTLISPTSLLCRGLTD